MSPLRRPNASLKLSGTLSEIYQFVKFLMFCAGQGDGLCLWDTTTQITVDLHTMLERLLLGPVGEELRKSPRHMPEEYEQWESAQTYSEIASEKSAAFKDVIYPLSKTRSKSTIDSLWRIIDLACFSVIFIYVTFTHYHPV